MIYEYTKFVPIISDYAGSVSGDQAMAQLNGLSWALHVSVSDIGIIERFDEKRPRESAAFQGHW
jgi:hypothetical protein